VQVSGTGFTGTTDVSFGGSPAAFTVDSDTSISTTVPIGAATGKVRVTNAADTAESPGDFLVIGAPEITSFSPNSGPAGTTVQITGSKFTDVFEVAFNDAVATTFTVDSDDQITAEVPATATTGKIRLSAAHGYGFSSDDFLVTKAVALGSTQTGVATNSDFVETTSPVTAVVGNLYLAAISSRQAGAVTSVTGLGATWTRAAAQCGGRGQTEAEVWMALAPTSVSEPVMATFAGTAGNAVIAITEYSDASPVAPVGSVVSANTNGISGICDGGTDGSSYSVPLTTMGGAAVYGAVTLRSRTHAEGAGYTELVELHQGSGGSAAGLAVQHRTVPTATSLVLDGSFGGDIDWAVIGLEIQPHVVTAVPAFALAVNSRDSRAVVDDAPIVTVEILPRGPRSSTLFRRPRAYAS
jgi:hypothetical protein